MRIFLWVNGVHTTIECRKRYGPQRTPRKSAEHAEKDEGAMRGTVLQGGSLFAAAGLDFDVDVHERNGRGGHAGNTRGVAEGARSDLEKFFLHLARQAADRAIV